MGSHKLPTAGLLADEDLATDQLEKELEAIGNELLYSLAPIGSQPLALPLASSRALDGKGAAVGAAFELLDSMNMHASELASVSVMLESSKYGVGDSSAILHRAAVLGDSIGD